MSYEPKYESREFVGVNRSDAVTKACAFFDTSEDALTITDLGPERVAGIGDRALLIAEPQDAPKRSPQREARHSDRDREPPGRDREPRGEMTMSLMHRGRSKTDHVGAGVDEAQACCLHPGQHVVLLVADQAGEGGRRGGPRDGPRDGQGGRDRRPLRAARDRGP